MRSRTRCNTLRTRWFTAVGVELSYVAIDKLRDGLDGAKVVRQQLLLIDDDAKVLFDELDDLQDAERIKERLSVGRGRLVGGTFAAPRI